MIYPENTDLAPEVEAWIFELDAAGPLSPPAVLQSLLDRVPPGVPADLLADVREVIENAR